MLVVITKVKYKILKGLRFVLVLTILAILLVQLVGLMKASGFYTHEKTPSGNPMRVTAPPAEACDDETSHGLLEQLIEQLLKNKDEENK